MFFKRHREDSNSKKGSHSWFGLHKPFDPKCRVVTSGILNPWLLFVWRTIVGIYCLTACIFHLIYQLNVNNLPGGEYYVYFTRLTFIGTTAYFCFAAFHTFFFALSLRRSKRHKAYHAPRYPLQNWGRFLQAAHWYLYSSVMTFPVIVSAVYWAILADDDTFASPFAAWTSITYHILNTVFVVIELFLSRGRIYWGYLIFCIATLAAYLGVAYTTYATQGFYVYSFLDPNKKPNRLVVYIVGILVAEIIVFIVVWGLAHIRDWILPRGKGIRVIDDEEDAIVV